MKRLVSILSVAVLLAGLLCGCNFTANMSDSMGLSIMEATAQVEQMFAALADGGTEQAVAFSAALRYHFINRRCCYGRI